MKILLSLITILFTLPAFAQGDIETRTFYEPEGDVFVGQTVRLWIEITTVGKITTSPQYPELKVEGAISLLPELGAVSFSDGSRIGLRQRYVIIPQRAGTVNIPPLQIIFGTELDGTTTEQTLIITPEPIQAITPPGTEDFDRIVTTSDLKVTETYDRELTDLKTGDAITRTVTIVAGGTFALALPETSFQPVNGARRYPATPQLSDSSNRGTYRATRIDAANYVFENAGETSLPEIVVQWFDPKSKSVQETILPAVDLSIAINPAYAESTAQYSKEETKTRILHQLGRALVWLQNNIVLLTMLAIGAYLIRLLWDRYYPVVARVWRTYREGVLRSEKYAFKQFQKSCRSNDLPKSKTAFWAWLNHFVSSQQTASLAAIKGKYPTLDTDILANILSPDANSNDRLKEFSTAATDLRDGLLATSSASDTTTKYALNPHHP